MTIGYSSGNAVEGCAGWPPAVSRELLLPRMKRASCDKVGRGPITSPQIFAAGQFALEPVPVVDRDLQGFLELLGIEVRQRERVTEDHEPGAVQREAPHDDVPVAQEGITCRFSSSRQIAVEISTQPESSMFVIRTT